MYTVTRRAKFPKYYEHILLQVSTLHSLQFTIAPAVAENKMWHSKLTKCKSFNIIPWIYIFSCHSIAFCCFIVTYSFVKIKFGRHFELIRRGTLCKLQLLCNFHAETAGCRYRRISVFACKNARRVFTPYFRMFNGTCWAT